MWGHWKVGGKGALRGGKDVCLASPNLACPLSLMFSILEGVELSVGEKGSTIGTPGTEHWPESVGKGNSNCWGWERTDRWKSSGARGKGKFLSPNPALLWAEVLTHQLCSLSAPAGDWNDHFAHSLTKDHVIRQVFGKVAGSSFTHKKLKDQNNDPG